MPPPYAALTVYGSSGKDQRQGLRCPGCLHAHAPPLGSPILLGVLILALPTAAAVAYSVALVMPMAKRPLATSGLSGPPARCGALVPCLLSWTSPWGPACPRPMHRGRAAGRGGRGELWHPLPP